MLFFIWQLFTMDGGCIIHNLGSGTGYSALDWDMGGGFFKLLYYTHVSHTILSYYTIKLFWVTEVLEMVKAFEAWEIPKHMLVSWIELGRALELLTRSTTHNFSNFSSYLCWQTRKEACGKKIAYKATQLWCSWSRCDVMWQFFLFMQASLISMCSVNVWNRWGVAECSLVWSLSAARWIG